MLSLRASLALPALTLIACGGNVVVDPAIGAGGAASSSTPSSSVVTTGGGGQGGGDPCEILVAAMTSSLAAAQACNPVLSVQQCSGATTAFNGCGCEVVANDANGAQAASALTAWKEWVGAGCGPYECAYCPPGPPSPWYCDPTTSECQPAYEK